MSKYCVDTYDYGRQYVWAKSPCAARSRIAYRIFGTPQNGESDMWEVKKVDEK